jgi:hypothetical protein
MNVSCWTFIRMAHLREQTTALGEPRGPRTELRMTPDAVAATVGPSGLALLQVEPIPPYHYAAIFEKL